MDRTVGSGGRRGGGKNKGFWHRKGRGWYITEGRSAVPLCDLNGNHIKRKDQVEEAKAAYARYVLRAGDPAKRGFTVMEACRLYLDHAKKGSADTYEMRKGLLFDLCTGFPAGLQDAEPAPKDRIHPGYGGKEARDLTTRDVDEWIEAHDGWKSPRAALQAVRRVTNYCVEVNALTVNPLAGLKVPQSGCRETYLSPEVEAVIYKHCKRVSKRSGRERSPALALAVQVMVRTGCRPDIEFNSLEARHVEETDRGQRWHFPAAESKGRKKSRTVYVAPEIAEIARQQIKLYPTGPLFRNERGNPWTLDGLQSAFKRLRGVLKRLKVEYVKPLIPYTCRHTYAKRMLGGFWGPPVTLEVLAGLMGNSPATCWKHYAKWSQQYVDPFWNAIDPTAQIASRGKPSPEQQPPSSPSSGSDGGQQ